MMNRPVNPRPLDELVRMTPKQLLHGYLTVEIDKDTGIPVIDIDEGEKPTKWERFRDYYRRIGVHDLRKIKILWRNRPVQRKSGT
jgi:hypothetical protein